MIDSPPVEAVRWHAAGDVRFEEAELALPLGPGTVEVDVAYCRIRGSDVAEFRARFAIRPGREHQLSGQSPPVTLGHEFAGHVAAVGEGVTGIAPGDRVSADACWRCGECAACVRFPAYCVEPLAVGLHALERGGARAGEPLVVVGYGPIGACTALVARALGLDPLVVERHQDRLGRAADEGLRVLDPQGSPREVSKEVRGLTGGGAAVVVDCTGSVPALEASLEMSRRGGRIVTAGIPKKPLPVDAGRLVLYERSLAGTLGYHTDLPRVAAMIAAGTLAPSGLITRPAPLAETPAELARLAKDSGDDVMVMIEVTA